MIIRQTYEERERQMLSPYACVSIHSQGRETDEDPDPLRTCFQRDRDRIIHCKSFRRLAYKTQVFLCPEGDHYRTRLTHTLEVAQIARALTRTLCLNEDLTEAISLGHDLGHTPFGHTGEAVLTRLLSEGFRHWEQSVRVVEHLEREGRGLNLTREVRDGIRMHSKGREEILHPFSSEFSTTLEAQVVRVADIIAYINHDLDDAIRAHILAPNDIPEAIRNLAGETHSQRITFMVHDVLAHTDLQKERLIRLSDGGYDLLHRLRDFLYERVYENPIVRRDMLKAERLIESLYRFFIEEDPTLFRCKFWPPGIDHKIPIERAAADFISMMTDRYALKLHEELLLPRPWQGTELLLFRR